MLSQKLAIKCLKMVLECRAESVFFSIHLHCVGLLLSPLLMSFLWLSLYFCCLWIFLPHMCFWNCLWETSGRPISRCSWFLSGYRCVFRIHVGRSRCQPAVKRSGTLLLLTTLLCLECVSHSRYLWCLADCVPLLPIHFLQGVISVQQSLISAQVLLTFD